MSAACSTANRASEDHCRRFLRRTVAPHDAQDARGGVRRHSFALQGRVRHCRSAAGGFKVGVELVFDDRVGDRGAQKSDPFGGMEPEA
jgi:hypothetical protein